MSQTKVKSGLLNFPDQTDFVKLPSGTTAQRPVDPEEGYTRFNTTTDKLEFFDGVRWVTAGETPPTLTSVDYPGNALAADVAGGETILINGTNFASGISVTIGTTEVSVVTLNSPTQLAITSPALSAGDYDVKVTNLDGSTITALDFISYNGVPSWVTASGSLGSLNFGEAISTITLSATEPDSGTVTYAVTSGALPSGLTLSSSGDITGTMPSGSSETTYSFTVTATDDENQSTDRAFTITGVVPFRPSQNFNTVLYNGSDSVQSVTGLGFQPDLVWLMGRNVSRNYMYAEINGNIEYGVSSSTAIWEDAGNALTSFDSDGFTLGDNFGSNEGGINYVAWCWKAGNSVNGTGTGGVSNVVQKPNIDAGFSLITYFGNNSAGTLTHGLNSTPELIIAHRTSGGTSGWNVCGNFGGLQYGSNRLRLEDASAITPDTNEIVEADSTTISVSTSSVINQGNIIMLAFHSVDGFSKFGSYTGADNLVIETGFEPAFIMIKSTTNSAGGWSIFDNKRGSNKRQYANLSTTEGTDGPPPILNFLENGFSFNTRDAWNNGSHNYIYMAFAADIRTQVPTKADSFNAVTYTGNGSQQSITGVGFQPSLTWVKARDINYDHQLHDSVRGPGYGLLSNLTAAENFYNTITSFDSDGFTVNASSFIGTNANGQTFVAWNWKGAEIPAINSNGSITSVVSANPAAGFSIVSYTGNGSNATIGHGLNNAPDVLIVKRRNADGSWNVYHSALGNNSTLILQSTTAEIIGAGTWGTTTPTSSVFTAGTSINDTNNYIAYCFAEVTGFSKFGSYVGTGASQTIVTGFEPAFVMIKRATGGSLNGWVLSDNKRGAGINLFANTIGTEGDESAYGPTSFTSNGFTLAQEGGNTNTSGSTYIYMAFANQF